MNTVERIHAYCHNAPTLSYDEDIYLQDTQKLMEEPISSQLVINNNYINTHYYKQIQLSEEMKYSLIKLSTLYWFNLFECIKVVNRYCRTIFNLGVNSMT